MNVTTSAPSGLSSRLHAHQLSRRVLAGEPPAKRSLIVDMDGDTCTCVYSAGAQALAVWRFDIAALRRLAGAVITGASQEVAIGLVQDEARRLIHGSRLAAVRGSIDKVVVIHARPTPLERILAAVILEALFATSGASPRVVEYAPRVSPRAAAGSRSVASAR
jgi:hypothetical protein